MLHREPDHGFIGGGSSGSGWGKFFRVFEEKATGATARRRRDYVARATGWDGGQRVRGVWSRRFVAEQAGGHAGLDLGGYGDVDADVVDAAVGKEADGGEGSLGGFSRIDGGCHCDSWARSGCDGGLRCVALSAL